MSLEEYETFIKILRSEDVFDNNVDRAFYEQSGYRDETVNEDVQQEEEFQKMYDKNALKDPK